MATGTVTLVSANPNRSCYSFAFTVGQTAVTLPFLTMLGDAVTGPLKTQLAALTAQTDTNAKAISALISGESFVGGGVGTPTIVSRINSYLVHMTLTSAAAATSVTAVDDGATDSPALVLTPSANAASTGFLFIVHVWSPNM